MKGGTVVYGKFTKTHRIHIGAGAKRRVRDILILYENRSTTITELTMDRLSGVLYIRDMMHRDDCRIRAGKVRVRRRCLTAAIPLPRR